MSSTAPPTTQAEEKDLPIEGVIAIACVCGLIITILIIVLLCVLRKRKQEKPERDYELEAQANRRSQSVSPSKNNTPRQSYNNKDNSVPLDVHERQESSERGESHDTGYRAVDQENTPTIGIKSDPVSYDEPSAQKSHVEDRYRTEHPEFIDQQASFQTDQGRSTQGSSGFSTPEPNKPTKIIYEVVV